MRYIKAILALGLAGLLALLTIQTGLATPPLGVTVETPSYLPLIMRHATLTPTATATATATRTATATATTTRTPTRTVTPTGPTPTPTRTKTVTVVATATRTPTPTRTEAPPNIQIAFIDFWPGGNEAQNEYVRIENHGAGPTTLTNWTLCDAQNNCYLFPAFTLAAFQSVKVWTGPAPNDTANLHWGRTDPVWDNGGDVATLRNNVGTLIDTYVYNAPLRVKKLR